MTLYTLRCEMRAPVTLEEAFRVFEDPHNLAKITPPWLKFQVAGNERVVMGRGARIDYRIRWFGLPLRWKSVIRDYQPPYRFVDEQEEGPYRFWRHTHEFTAAAEGTRVLDEVEYRLPLGPLGSVGHALVVGHQLKEIFRYRQATLPALIGGDTAAYRCSEVTIQES